MNNLILENEKFLENTENVKQLGMYYTNEENILKLIRPLFLDELQEEMHLQKKSIEGLKKFHKRISKLKFLDPACGCGNFLFVTYFKLIELEIEIIKIFVDNKIEFYPLVNQSQFIGIEINKDVCNKCKENMNTIEIEINNIYSNIFNIKRNFKFKCYILNENALQIDWNDVVPKEKLDYIMGNPPFAGARLMSKIQKDDLCEVWKGHNKIGNLDYVTAWYKKAADYMENTKVESAFVSTNSISQGEQPAILWEPLIKENNTVINFAYRTFKWGNEAKGKKAAVHCVIIGFSDYQNYREKKIFDKENQSKVLNINPYLVNAPNIIVKARATSICNAPKILTGNMPNDGGFLLLNEDEKKTLEGKESNAHTYIKRYIMGEDLLYNIKRYCLWLKGKTPSELKNSVFIMNRLAKVKSLRKNSSRPATQKLSKFPTLFGEIRQPDKQYLAIPQTSAGNRDYIPMVFLSREIIAGNKLLIIPDANIYHFGILSSCVHMAWMRTVGCYYGPSYSYSNNIVYNNFIWPNPTPKQKEAIETAAQAVLDARKLYPKSTLADLYDPNIMPPELTRAHEKLDKSVKVAYGNKGFETEEEIVASLMKLYKDKINEM